MDDATMFKTQVYAELCSRLPPLTKTELNDRTCWAWHRHWIGERSIKEIAEEAGWCVPAVTWHLRRADRVLK